MTQPATDQQSQPRTGTAAIRPFTVRVPDEALADLRKRLERTRWPDRETVQDRSQGVRLADLQPLVEHWRTKYDWRKAEARLNALPQFVTTIDGVDIHFIHVRSKHPDAMPLIITHGWPGSVFELLDVIGPLTDPTAHGATAGDAFDVVLPSLPGYGFSARPKEAGWTPERTARAWAVLMKRLGYTRYVAQGGDLGAFVTNDLARHAPPGLLGVHISLPAVLTDDVGAALVSGGPAPAGLSEKERAAFDAIRTYATRDAAYNVMMSTKPQTIGFALADSPVGLAAWMLGHPGFSDWAYGSDTSDAKTRDHVLDDITLYWLTNTATSAARAYWENKGRNPVSATAMQTSEIRLPVAVTAFPREVYRAPESWLRRTYPNLIYFNDADKGGHFASWEAPLLFANEMRAAFKSLRDDGKRP